MPFFIDTTDDPLLQEVIQSFAGGQNSFVRSSLLPDGQASQLLNFVIAINGELRKRLGTRNVFSGYVGGQDKKIQGILYYDTPVATALIAFVNGKARYFDGLIWADYFDADITNINEVVDSVQLTDLVLWTDSNKVGVRMFDGADVSTIATSPKATILETITNRVAASGMPDVPDEVDFSDILDCSTWNVNNKLRIGGGEGSPITALRTWQDTNLLVFKRQGIYLISCDPTATTAADFSVLKIHNTIGCVARKSVAQLGQDVWFLSRNGVMSVQKQLATSQNVVAVPVSQPIQDLIGNIRWNMAYKSCAVTYNNMYLLAVPIDSDEPDTVLVYHYLTGGWTYFKGWTVTQFLEQPYLGATRLLIGCVDGEMFEWLDYLRDDQVEPEDDYKDSLVGVLIPFQLPLYLPPRSAVMSVLETRALTYGDIFSTKSPFYGSIEVLQKNGTVTLYMIRDGQKKELIDEWEFVPPPGFNLPLTLPFDLPIAPNWTRKVFPIFDHDTFLEMRFRVESDQGAFSLRRITCSAMMNTVELIGE